MPLLPFIILSLLRSELQVPAELHASLSACSAACLPPPYPERCFQSFPCSLEAVHPPGPARAPVGPVPPPSSPSSANWVPLCK